MLLVFRLLTIGQLSLTDELLFHKRISPALLSTARTPGPALLVKKLSRFLTIFQGWYAYISGYRHMINRLDTLSPQEKAQLNVLLRGRIVEICWDRLRVGLVVPAVRQATDGSSLPGALDMTKNG